MKNKYGIRLLVIAFLSTFAVDIRYSCSDNGGEGVKVYGYREQIGKKIEALADLQTEFQFGLREGVYPETGRAILEDAVAELRDSSQTIEEVGVVEARIPEGTTKLPKELDEKIVESKAVVWVGDLLVPAELEISGKSGGYIDPGTHLEYSTFGKADKQTFTVEFWVKLKDVEGFFYLISTFTDDDTNNHERRGWRVNSYNYGGNNMCMTYGMSFNDLMEPAFGLATANEWIHSAVITDETEIDSEVNEGRPAITKMYMNGELKLSTTSHQDASEPYASNDSNVPIVAFGGTSATGNRISDKGANGSMKHLHIWRTAKTQDEICRLMEHPENVAGEEDDLVCEWTFAKMVLDDQEIKDLTGKYTAKLIGDYKWIRLE